MNSNFFFKKKNYKLQEILSKDKIKKNFIINDIKPLHIAQKNDLTFFDSIKYKDEASNTKGGACITTSIISLTMYHFTMYCELLLIM